MGWITSSSSYILRIRVPSPLTFTTPPKSLTILPFTGVMAPMKLLDLLDMVVEAWLSIPIMNESDSNGKFYGLLRMSKVFSDE